MLISGSKRHRSIFVFAILFWAMFLFACNQSSTATANDLADNPADPQTMLQEAEAAFAAGDFEAAFELSQQVVQVSPEDEAAWEMIRLATIAQAGDEYLRWLPDGRYQLSPEDFLAEQANGRDYFILDVRELDAYQDGHIEDAVNIPLRELLNNTEQLPDTAVPILVYCCSMRRSTHALVILRQLGYVQAFNLAGGYTAYEEFITNNLAPTPGPTPTLEPVDNSDGC